MNKEEIQFLCEKYGIGNYKIKADMTIDVYGSVIIDSILIGELPMVFNRVEGDFTCRGNSLTTLRGAPRYVGGSFVCGNNELRNLIGGPEYVGGSYFCNLNFLESLEGIARGMQGIVNCKDNHLTSLKHAPEVVKTIFNCENNRLTSLEFCPQIIGSYLRASDNLITTLKYHPKEIKGTMYLNNNSITVPPSDFFMVDGNFDIYKNPMNIQHLKIKIGNEITIDRNSSYDDVFHLMDLGYGWEDIHCPDMDMIMLARQYTIKNIIGK